MKTFIFLLSFLSFFLATSPNSNLQAALVDISLTCRGGGSFQAALNTACETLEEDAEADANKGLPNIKLDEFSKGFANAAVISTKGAGTDYANDFSIFLISAGVGIGADTRNKTLSDSSSDGDLTGGVAIMPHLTLGLNMNMLPIPKLGPIDFSKMDVFLNAFNYNISRDQDDMEVEGSVSSFGLMVRYDLMDSISFVPGGIVKWGGIQMHTGYQYSKMQIEISSEQDFEEEEEITGVANATANIEGTAEANLDITSAVHTIPVEFSTSIQLLYVFSLYGGLGFDFNSGTNKSDLDVDGDIDGTVSLGGATITGDVSVNEDESKKPDSLFTRGFMGAQFNIPYFKIYLEGHKVFGKNVVAANVGFKILF